MRFAIQFVAASALLAGATAAFSQNSALPAPQQVLQLSASASTEVAQDWLQLTLASTHEGSDAGAVQAQLRQDLEGAQALLRRQAQPGQLEWRSGAFAITPRYGKDGKISGWQGRAELLLQGRDFGRITSTAAQVPGMVIRQIGFALSPQARTEAESQVQAQAVARFQAKAQELSRSFGFTGYSLREVQVNSHESSPGPQPRMWAMAAKAAPMDDAPLPVEAGKAQVEVSISGSVQMH